MSFKTHEDLFKALIEGKKIIHKRFDCMVKLSNSLLDYTKQDGSCFESGSLVPTFAHPDEWSIHREKIVCDECTWITLTNGFGTVFPTPDIHWKSKEVMKKILEKDPFIKTRLTIEFID